MEQLARIYFPRGAVFLSAETPYDRELVFDHVDLDTRQYGQVRFALDRHRCFARVTRPGALVVCARCAQRVGGLAYSVDARCLCARCARSALAA